MIPQLSCTVELRRMLLRKKLLFVDDEPTYLNLVLRLLDTNLYESHILSEPEAVVGYLKENDVDVLITDLIMPDINGIELIRSVREWLPDLPVVVISGQQDMDMTIEAMRLGSVEYIRKPFEIESLMIAIESALEKKTLREQLRDANRQLNRQLEIQTDKLEKSRIFFNAMAENSQEILIELDLDLNYVYCSPNTMGISGFTVEETLGKNLYEMVQEEDRERLQTLHDELVANPTTFSGMEFGSFDRDGQPMVYEVTGIPLLDKDGNLQGFLGLLRNVTEEKRSRQRIEASRNWLMTAVESIPFEFFSMDNSGRVILQNKQSREGLWGTIEGENLRTIEILINGIPGFRSIVDDSIRGVVVDHEWDIRIAEERRYFRFILSPIVNNGEVSGVVGFNIDITERKTAQEELIRVSAAVAQVQETILLTDLKGNLTYANPAFRDVSGFTEAEYMGRCPFELLKSTDGMHSLKREDVTSVFQDDIWKMRCYNTSKDKKEYVEDVTISPIRNRKGEMIQFVCVGRNITEELKIEKKFMHAQKMEAIGTLAGGIAHDFNNILSSITGYTQLVQDDIPEGSEAAENVEQVLIASGRAEKLIKQILLFGRRDQQLPVVMDAVSMIREVTSLLKSAIPSGIRVDCRDMPEEFFILADPTQLHQVILNLSTNAIDAMRETGGTLILRFNGLSCLPDSIEDGNEHGAGDWVCLEVEDTGTGISDEIINKIFDPFFTTKPLDRGTGMGLSVVHGIVKELHGHILVDSALEKGTVFRVYLPVGDLEENSRGDAAAKSVIDKKIRILIVDDDISILNMEKIRLGKDGWKVTTASSGSQALELLSGEDAFDLVITDLKMPEMNGDELCRKIKARFKKIPVILLTSHLKDSPYSSIDYSNFNSVLTKPVSREVLIDTISETISFLGSSGTRCRK